MAEYGQILVNILGNAFIWILHLFPFWIFDNITAFFPETYQNPYIMVFIAFIAWWFWFVYVVYLASILLIPVDDNVQMDRDWNIPYNQTFLWQTIRFILWSKNIVTYMTVFTKFVSKLGIKIVPLLLIFSFVYFPIMPKTQGYVTLWQYVNDNAAIFHALFANTGSTQAEAMLKNKYASATPDITNLQSKEYVEKRMLNTYQNDAAIKSTIYDETKQFATISDLTQYEAALAGYINTKMPTLIQDSKNNENIEKQKQIIYGAIYSMQQSLYDKKQRAIWNQPIELFWWRVLYTWFQVKQLWYFVTVINFLLATLLTLVIILLSGWKNMLLIYLYLMEILSQKFEKLNSKEFFKNLQSMNKKLKAIGTDIQEWDIIVQNWWSKEVYILLVVEIMIRILLVYYFVYFSTFWTW